MYYVRWALKLRWAFATNAACKEYRELWDSTAFLRHMPAAVGHCCGIVECASPTIRVGAFWWSRCARRWPGEDANRMRGYYIVSPIGTSCFLLIRLLAELPSVMRYVYCHCIGRPLPARPLSRGGLQLVGTLPVVLRPALIGLRLHSWRRPAF